MYISPSSSHFLLLITRFHFQHKLHIEDFALHNTFYWHVECNLPLPNHFPEFMWLKESFFSWPSPSLLQRSRSPEPVSPRVSRGVDDSVIFSPPDGVVLRKKNIKKFNTVAYRGDSRPNKWKRASINGHIYNFDVSAPYISFTCKLYYMYLISSGEQIILHLMIYCKSYCIFR